MSRDINLTREAKARYSRNIAIEEIGLAGQKKLLGSHVLVVGAGGLGSPALYYLAAAGVGKITIVDFDNIETSNLQRQIIHTGAESGKPKVLSAKKKLNALNPCLKIVTHQLKFSADNAGRLIKDCDFVLECTDNFEAKFLVNDACVAAKKPFSHCGVLRFQGQIMTYVPGHACYRCVFAAPPKNGTVFTSAEVGILGAVPGVFGSLQAAEAIKYILGAGELLVDRILTGNLLTMDFRTISVKFNPNCKAGHE